MERCITNCNSHIFLKQFCNSTHVMGLMFIWYRYKLTSLTHINFLTQRTNCSSVYSDL